MGELQSLINIAGEMERQLCAVGIETIDELRRVGSKQAWLRILAVDASACLNRLMGLEGAIEGVRWHHLPEEKKDELRAFYREHKG